MFAWFSEGRCQRKEGRARHRLRTSTALLVCVYLEIPPSSVGGRLAGDFDEATDLFVGDAAEAKCPEWRRRPKHGMTGGLDWGKNPGETSPGEIDAVCRAVGRRTGIRATWPRAVPRPPSPLRDVPGAIRLPSRGGAFLLVSGVRVPDPKGVS